ncbi:MAG: hypothetical protein IPN34_08715 [Planctomycetes bacterium]|nr:hypothetical protein [Planctomycetota bacterium]
MKALLPLLVASTLLASLLSPERRAFVAFAAQEPSAPVPAARAPQVGPSGTCGTCHQGLEVMHPWHPLGCVDCHGGNDQAPAKEQAHVGSRSQLPNDERVLPFAADKALLRFLNPSDLRVVGETCGSCHAEVVERVKKSLHATTAGHLCDGLYENGVIAKRSSPYGIFGVTDDEVRSEHGVKALKAFPPFAGGDRDELSTHFQDLGRKSCMRCHLWSSGSAVRGRLGQDGDYRGSGCAACHVVYAEDGLSRSADPTVDRFAPGHPKVHAMTTAPPTDTCVSCHVGDASIGMHFRGLAQLVPGMPAGPDVPNTTSTPKNGGAFYIQDPVLTPPDVHHQRGMHCVDCHTGRDVMGDGELHEAMEHAIEIECSDCHGSFEERSKLMTSRGNPLKHLRREGEAVILTSRVTGQEHVVPQVVDIVDPKSPRYNAVAAKAMNAFHRQLECYACHTAWNVNFFGFHFDRNEAFTQLDLISGQRSEGRVTTQEKVFATLKEFRLGWNSEGKIAPYMVGFSSMGSVHAADGSFAMRQELPETAAGLSGMTMIHHQVHAVQPAARGCVECHRSSTTFGTGSPNYRLARDLVFAVGQQGLGVIAYDPRNPTLGLPLAQLALPGASRALPRVDAVHGRTEVVFVAAAARRNDFGERIANGYVALVDARDPLSPRVQSTLELHDPRALALHGEQLLVADGAGGVKVLREKDGALRLVGAVATVEARDLAVHGPHAFVADGAGGLALIDLADPELPRVISALHLGGNEAIPDEANAVAVLWQGSRPRPAERARTPARLLVALADGEQGLGSRRRDGAFAPEAREARRRSRPER